MATDLTIKFQENFTATVETGLSKEITLNNTYKSSSELLTNKSFLAIDTNFDFNDKTLSIRYLLELPISSLILHSMMFEDYTLEEELNEDLKDACKEFVSQISGALETLINGEGFEDITGVKFSVGDINSFSDSVYSPLSEIFRFDLEIDNNPFDLFIDLSEQSLEYFEMLTKMEDDPKLNDIAESPLEENQVEPQETTQDDDISMIPDELADALEEHNDDAPDVSNDDKSVEVKEEAQEPTKEETAQTTEESPNTQNTEEDNSTEVKPEEDKKDDEDQETEGEFQEQQEDKKKKKLKLLIMILGGLILVLVITILTIFFMGVFDEPEVVDENNTTKQPTKQELIIAEIKNKQIDFDASMINEKRINKKLALLTKYEILEEDIVAKFQKDEKERLYQLKIKRLEEFAQNNKEESLFKTTLNKDNNYSIVNEDNTSLKQELALIQDPSYLNEKLTFIKVAPIEYKNFKDIISKEKTSSTLISMCKDKKGKVNIYIGPMYLTLETNNIIKAVRKTYPDKKSSITLSEIIRKDFNSMCNF